MEEYITHGLMGAGAGICIAAAGYIKARTKDAEAFDVQKAGISIGVGAFAGFVICTGMLNYEGLLVVLSMAGLSHYGETAGKSVWNFFGSDTTEGKKKKK